MLFDPCTFCLQNRVWICTISDWICIITVKQNAIQFASVPSRLPLEVVRRMWSEMELGKDFYIGNVPSVIYDELTTP